MSYYCGDCHAECTPENQEVGQYRFDPDAIYLSDCCGADIFIDEGCTIEFDSREYHYEQLCDAADHHRDCIRDQEAMRRG